MLNTKRLALLVFPFVFFGCASLQKRADEQLQAGNYDQAEGLYEQVVAREPNNAEARANLLKARAGALDKQLIQVRMARMSGAAEQAMDLLLNVALREKTWGYFPSTKVGFTQDEETGYAFPVFSAKVKQSIREKHPLQAQFIYLKYGPVFSSENFLRRYNQLNAEITQSGSASCKQFRSVAKKNLPYYADFVQKYCEHWGEDFEEGNNEDVKLGDLYNDVTFSGNMEKFPQDMQLELKKQLQQAFEGTAWYDARGKRKANISLTANYNESHTKDLVNLVHNYQASEPYEALENVTKTRHIPYASMQTQTNPTTGQTTQVPVTLYRDEQYTVQEKVIRYRPVTKSFPYNAIKHVQNLDISLGATLGLADRTIQISQADKSNREGYESDLSNPEIGLQPQRPNLVDPPAWIRENLAKLQDQLKQRASAEWVSAYCTTASGPSLAAVGDQINKCLRAPMSQIPGFAQDWYMQNLGLSYQDANATMTK